MVSCPITSWQTEGGKLEVVTDFLFLGSKTTADSNWSHEIKRHSLLGSWASLMAQLVKNLPAMRETWVWSLGWEDPLEKGKATLQYSCLENSRDCIDYGVAKSWSWLMRKAMTNLDSILKSRGIILLAKVHIIKAMVFPVVMCGCEIWDIK